jgi:hypothetical protein
MKKLLWLFLIICLPGLIAGKPHSEVKDWLAITISQTDFNNTLHSQFLKDRVLKLAAFVANSSYFALTGGVLDFKKRKYIYFSKPLSIQTRLEQSHKLKKLGQALLRTRDDDFKVAGGVLIDLSNSIAQGDKEASKKSLSKFNDFWLASIKPEPIQGKDAELLQKISDSIVSEFKSLFGGFTGNVQNSAVEALNLQSVIGGLH